MDALRVAKRLLLSLYVHAERLAQRRQRIDGIDALTPASDASTAAATPTSCRSASR
ncbi:MAG TPA: hypothetical protein VIL19_10240 [Casimicrobiaceae bacterium]